MGFEISLTSFSTFFTAFAVFLAFLWGIKKAIGLIK